VGSWAVEALARSGVAELVLIDLDHVAESNINRQIHALGATLGRPRCRRCASASRRSIPAAACTWSRPSSSGRLAGAAARAGRRGDRRLRPGAREGRASPRWALRERVPLVAVGARGGKRLAQAVEVADLAESRTIRCWPRCASGCASARRAAQGRDRRALRVLARAVRRPRGARATVEASLNCHGYGSSVAVTASFGLAAAGEAIERLPRVARRIGAASMN
jgi:tRNA A37 threonylcarbamoyladenosine dehydratase